MPGGTNAGNTDGRQKKGLNKVFEHDVVINGEVIWEKCTYHEDTNTYDGGTLDRIRKIVERDNILYTEYAYCEKGELFNATIKIKMEIRPFH